MTIEQVRANQCIAAVAFKRLGSFVIHIQNDAFAIADSDCRGKLLNPICVVPYMLQSFEIECISESITSRDSELPSKLQWTATATFRDNRTAIAFGGQSVALA